MAEALTRGFTTPAEVTGYFDGKGDRPGFSWLDVWGEEHAYGFTVAKAVDVELRSTFRKSISKAITESHSFETWQKDVVGQLEAIGWGRPRTVSDPTGMDPDKLVDFTDPRRLRTIFSSNMKSARAAGQWERAQRTKAALPYLLYIRSASAEPRQEHLGWAGIILPIDDPWWRTHFPPNGWGCKCAVRQITARERDKLLNAERKEDGIWYVAEAPDDGPARIFYNRRSGETTSVPAGIDPGWHTNPGLSRTETLIDNLNLKLEDADPADATMIVESLWEDPFLPIATKLPEKSWLPAGVGPALQEELGAVNPVIGIDSEAIADRMARHGSKVEDFAKLPAILANARIFPDLTAQQRPTVRDLFARISKTWWKVVVVKSKTGRMRVMSMSQRDARRVADQILDGGFGRTEMLAAGFEDEEIEGLVRGWKSRRGGKEEPPRL